MVELLLDPAIRLWVILPIVLITLMVGLVRHYITILLKSDRKPGLSDLRDGYVTKVHHISASTTRQATELTHSLSLTH